MPQIALAQQESTGVVSLSGTEADREIERELRYLEKNITAEKTQLAKVKNERLKIEKELLKIQKKIDTAEIDRSKLKKRVKRLNKATEELELQADIIKKDLARLRERFHKRVIGVYKMNRQSSSLDYLFKAASATDLLKRNYYLTKVAKADKELIQALLKTEETLRESAVELAKSKAERKQKISSLQKVLLGLEKNKSQKANAVDSRKRKERTIRKSLGSLRSSAENLQRMIGVLIVRGEEKSKEIIVETSNKIPTKTPKVALSGLAKLKGSLSFPVQGKVIQGYGKRKHDEFSDILFSKGLDVVADSSSLVAAVAQGKIILERELPGYGKVAILDHGRRYYTLYGRLGQVNQEVGSFLQARDEIASVNPSEQGESNFYFELRYKGKAINPNKFFSSVPR